MHLLMIHCGALHNHKEKFIHSQSHSHEINIHSLPNTEHNGPIHYKHLIIQSFYSLFDCTITPYLQELIEWHISHI